MSDQTILIKPRVGVVLSSGGVRGVYAHTGFLMALENIKIENYLFNVNSILICGELFNIAGISL